MIAFQPPWVLSEQDIREFSECRSVSRHADDVVSIDLMDLWSFPHSGIRAMPSQSLFEAKKDFGPR